jgi:hypothetical protein
MTKLYFIWQKIKWLVFLLYIIASIGLIVKAYSESIYIISRDVSSHLDYASKLTNAKTIGDELEIALKNLEPYHGNPCWFFPIINTDIDYIKAMLKSQLDMARTVEKLPPSDYAYQRFIENCIRTIPQLKDNVDLYSRWLLFNPMNVCLAIVWLIIEIILIGSVLE